MGWDRKREKNLRPPSTTTSHHLHARASSRLLSHLLGEAGGTGGGRADLLPAVRRCWEGAVGAAPALAWPGPPEAAARAAGAAVAAPPGLTSAGAAVAALLAEEEDILGPPFVEPNRHCTLMFYLNSPEGGGGETTFPLAEGPAAVADASGALLRGAAVVHPGMPECSRGLRVRPFRGGGALFYHKFGNGTNDERSSHGGCPPHAPAGGGESTSWKINGFMWNTDANTGPGLFRG